MHFETLAIHAGQEPDPATGAVITPIYQTSTFVQEAVGQHKGYEYSRTDNPTRTALQSALAALEGATWGLCYASGLAATQNLWYLLSPGEHVILSDDVYGGTYRLADSVLARYGIEYSLVDLCDLDAVRAAIRPSTRMIWVETPTNPLLKIIDIAAIARIIEGSSIRLVVDNTFASPYLQQPLVLGADLVVHSTTKYLGGHSDVVGGAILGNDPEVLRALKFHQNAAGAIPGPFDCWLVLRGIKTLAIRMRQHCANARTIAGMLQEHPAVEQVFYPGLSTHPNHEVAARQMPKGFGGMVSFTMAAGEAAARAAVQRTKLFALAESLGGVESLIEHPALMTHASMAESGSAVPDNLIRLSVGIENVEDLMADLTQALDLAAS
ncbi:cystathionine gamma-synthase [Nitrolancea hollandica]|uniref:Cystathionine gamma-lyase and homocysteine gamma-lyase for reverse transsulfuration pathway n=1 Tax=Nitrolancea hollandica Lb TaxID=1129897 RepID=I4ECL6_9BACT|nr:cystathionine gamma-synthase [Nitrolancea hollandica]CCF82428.1 cystathionine gamma-lyase and homocysteine gamma-lyase for reverse transsulfuration pathway [Nitrolancea hollandica Lb]